jgi:hypothetical protein
MRPVPFLFRIVLCSLPLVLLLSRVGFAFIKRRLSLLILSIIFNVFLYICQNILSVKYTILHLNTKSNERCNIFFNSIFSRKNKNKHSDVLFIQCLLIAKEVIFPLLLQKYWLNTNNRNITVLPTLRI